MGTNLSRLGLGTVQFGMDYGITNRSGMTPQKDVNTILAEAYKRGVRTLDTANLYGESENVLGCALTPDQNFRIVTKAAPLDSDGRKKLLENFENSLKKLKRSNVYGLLLHKAMDFCGTNGDGLYADLVNLKQSGFIQKIGVSIYSQKEIEDVLAKVDIDLIQIPLSIFDQRLAKSGILKELKKSGIEIHARSVFLQGIVYEIPENLPDHLYGLKKPLSIFRQLCERYNLTPASAALSYVLAQPEIDCLICGVNTHAQFMELCENFSAAENISPEEFKAIAVDYEELINPSLWNAQKVNA